MNNFKEHNKFMTHNPMLSMRDNIGSCGGSQSPLLSDDEKEDCDFYEGTEKLLEIWFSRSDGLTEGCDLRKIKRSDW